MTHSLSQHCPNCEAQAAEIEKLQFLCDLNAVPAGIIEDRGRTEERAKIVAWLRERDGFNDCYSELKDQWLSDRIARGDHLK